jgi:exopolysaccharide biosynthesis polyprenyl glycosylphosphotransferase
MIMRNCDLYIFCPESSVDKIRKTIGKHISNIYFNDYAVDVSSDIDICHYELGSLDKEKREWLVSATERGARVEPLVSFMDSALNYTEVDLLNSSYFLHQKAFGILSKNRTRVAKRILDVLGSIILLLIFSPIMLITAVLVKLESKGPIFYKQKRVGLFNKEFSVIKFRSMAADAEKAGAQWAKKNDPRITKVGAFIRKTRIDELPQLINVIIGEMSLVGPRPERKVFIKELEKVIPYYKFRHAVKPGITGLAQVNYPYGDSIEDAVWKHKYDIFYIKYHRSFLDLKILLLTIKVVLFGMGR